MSEGTEVDCLRQGDIVLLAQGITFSYGGVPVIEQLDLQVRLGESVAIMGESGSGKSSLLNLLCGITLPSSGSVHVAGTSVSTLSNSARARMRLHQFGFVFQSGELLPELTIRENVELPLLFGGHSRPEAREDAEAALSTVGLHNLGERGLAEVSGGQLQRAAVARAMAHQPRIILADEPTGSLDRDNEESVMELLLSAVEGRGAALVLATHSEHVAARCDRTLMLERGQLCPRVSVGGV